MRNRGWSGSSVPPPVSHVDVIRLGLCVEGAGRFIGHDDGAALLKGAPSHCAGVHLRRNVIYDRSHRSGFNRVKAPACVACSIDEARESGGKDTARTLLFGPCRAYKRVAP